MHSSALHKGGIVVHMYKLNLLHIKMFLKKKNYVQHIIKTKEQMNDGFFFCASSTIMQRKHMFEIWLAFFQGHGIYWSKTCR